MTDRTSSWIQRRNDSIPAAIANMTPLFIESGTNARVRDIEGNTYLDFASGIGVNNLGHCHERVVAAIREQSEQYLHACFHVMMYTPYVRLAEKLNALVPVTGTPKTMLANSGAEAVENAVKIARAHTRKRAVVCFDNAFHGRTMLTMTMTSKIRPNKVNTGAWAPGIYRIHFPYCYRCPWNLEYGSCGMACGASYFENYVFKYQVDPEDTAAIILEPVQGEGGFVPVPPGYLEQVRQVCDRHNIVLIFDEIQSGFGRTARMFAAEHYGVSPDIMTMAKSLGGGLPISAVTGNSDMMDSVATGGLGGTYGGNPVACAAALAVLETFEQTDILARASDIGDTVRTALLKLKDSFECIGDVRGLGAMMAMEIIKKDGTMEPDGETAGAVVRHCRENGLLVLSCGTFKNNIRLLMPLTIEQKELERGLDIISTAVAACC